MPWWGPWVGFSRSVFRSFFYCRFPVWPLERHGGHSPHDAETLLSSDLPCNSLAFFTRYNTGTYCLISWYFFLSGSAKGLFLFNADHNLELSLLALFKDDEQQEQHSDLQLESQHRSHKGWYDLDFLALLETKQEHGNLLHIANDCWTEAVSLAWS